MPTWKTAVICRRWTLELTFSCIQKAKQLNLLLVNMALDFLVWEVFQIFLVSHRLDFHLDFLTGWQYFMCHLESEDQSGLCLFLVFIPFWKNVPSLREKDGTSFPFTCIGGISSNQNAVVSEDERQLYTGFNYSMNFRGNYNYYKRLFKNSLNFIIF